MTSTSLHSPKSVKMMELSSGAIVLDVYEESGSHVSIFFDTHEDFISFTSTLRRGGTYGNSIKI